MLYIRLKPPGGAGVVLGPRLEAGRASAPFYYARMENTMADLEFASCEDHKPFQTGLAGILDRLRDEGDGGDNAISTGGRVLDFIKALLSQIEIPPKDVVLAGVVALLDRIFDKVDVPGPDAVVEPLIKAAILSAVGSAYDQLVTE